MTGFVEVSQNEMMVVDGGDVLSGESPLTPEQLIAIATGIASCTYVAGLAVGKWIAGLFN